jgi:hypothetical protein
MRWVEKSRWPEQTTRELTRFCWWPVWARLPDGRVETRWLERATWTETFTWPPGCDYPEWGQYRKWVIPDQPAP